MKSVAKPFNCYYHLRHYPFSYSGGSYLIFFFFLQIFTMEETVLFFLQIFIVGEAILSFTNLYNGGS